MPMPIFYRETLAHARAQPLWAAAFLLTALIVFMIIFARVGFEVCAALVGLMFLWHSARTRDWHWLRDPLAMVCLLIWAWMLLVVQPLAVSPSARWMEAVAWIRFPLMFMALRFWVLAVPGARTTLAVIIASLLDTLWQFVQGVSLSGNARTLTGRLTGPFETPKIGLFMGKFAVAALALCMAVALAANARRWVVGAALLWALVMLTVLLSGERSAFLLLALATGVIAVLMALRNSRLRMPCILLALGALLGVVALYEGSPWVRERANAGYETITHYRESDYGALAISAYDLGAAHPLHGVGIRGYRGMSPDLYYKGQKFRGLHPHHAFLEMFSESGVPGLLLMMAMIAVLARNAAQQFKAAKGINALLPAAAIGVLVQHFFPLIGMQSFFSNWAAVNLWFCLAIIFSAIPTTHARVNHA
jgi:O-antigen ligase